MSPVGLFVSGSGLPEHQCGLSLGCGHDECGESEPRGGGGLTQKLHLLAGGPKIDAFGT